MRICADRCKEKVNLDNYIPYSGVSVYRNRLHILYTSVKINVLTDVL